MASVWEVLFPAMAGIAGSLGASYAGARHAFKLEERRRKRDEEARQIAVLNDCLVTLTWCRNRIYNIRTQVVEPVRCHPLRHLRAQAVMETEMPPQLAQSAPSALSGKAELINAFYRAVSATLYAKNAFRFVEAYSKYHITHLQPLLASLPILQDADAIDLRDLSRALPKHIEITLKRYFDGVVQCTDEARTELRLAEEELWKQAKETFPDERFFYGKVPDDPPPSWAK